jgi:hypothetical protein
MTGLPPTNRKPAVSPATPALSASKNRWHGGRLSADHGIVRILVTGHRGHVGAPVAAHLNSAGHDVIGYDRLDGDDLLDAASVRRAAEGCAAIVHAGALAHDTAGSPEDIMAVNVRG